MLPSRVNEEPLLDMLRGEGGFFGARPEVWSWAELYRHLVPRGELRRGIDPPDHRLILRFVLDRSVAELDAAGISLPKGVRHRGFLDLLSASIRELLLEDVPPDGLLYRAPGEPAPAASGAEISLRELLYRLYTDYLIYLEENGLCDNAQMPSLARLGVLSRRPDVLEAATLCWVGFLSFTGAQVGLIRALSGLGLRMLFYAPESGVPDFRDASSQLGAAARNDFAREGEIVTLEGRSVYDQYEGVAREIALAYAGAGALCDSPGSPEGAPPDIGVLLPPDRVALMASALSKQGVPWQSRAEVAVGETVLAGIVRSAWEAYRQHWPARRTRFLLSHPVLGAEAIDERRYEREVPEGFPAWSRFLSAQPPLLEVLTRLRTFCEYLDEPEGHTPEELLRALYALASEGDWVRTVASLAGEDAALDAPVREFASACLEVRQKIESLEEQRPAIGPAGDVRFSGSDAMAYLSSWSAEATTALPPPLAGVVALYDTPPPVLVSHDIFVMTDVEPARFPGQVADGALLDAEVREFVNREMEDAAHLPTLREKRSQKEALFRRLLSVGSRVSLVSRPLADTQGRPVEESPFLRAALRDGRWRLRSHVGEPGAEDATAEGAAPHRGTFPRVVLHGPTLVRDAAGLGRIQIPVSSVDDFRDCPFLYWCRYVARLPLPRDVAPGLMDRPLQGVLMHEIWRELWEERDASEGPSLLTALRSRWDAMIAARALRFPVLTDARAAPVLRKLEGAMRRVAAVQDEIEARAGERGMKREKTLHEADLPPFRVEGVVYTARADRLDVWEDGRIVLVDYKLGKSGNYRNSLQLPIYAAMLGEAGGGDVAGFCYIGHDDAALRGAFAPEMSEVYRAAGRSPAMAPLIQEGVAAMQEMASAVMSGRYAANYDALRCPRCGYRTICRRAERLGVREAEEGGEPDDGASAD